MNFLRRINCLTALVTRLQNALNAWTTDSIVKVSSDYTVQLTDSTIEANTSGGPVTLTLPDATAASGMRKTFKRIPGGGDDVTIVPIGTDMIDADTSYIISNDWGSVTFRASAGANPGDPGIWLITAAYNV